MPIFDQSYRPYAGPRTGRIARIWAICLSALLPSLKNRRLRLLLGAANIKFLYRVVILYTSDYTQKLGMDQVQQLLKQPKGAELLAQFLQGQLLWLFIITVYAGAGLIANDLRSGALPLYLSRPVKRTDYVLGKLLALMVLGSLITCLPALLLWVVSAMRGFDGPGLEALGTLFAMLGSSLMVLLVFGLAVLAFSSMTTSSKSAGAYFAILYLFTGVGSKILQKATGAGWPVFLSFSDLLVQAERWILGLGPTPSSLAPGIGWQSLLIATGIVAVCTTMLWWRITSRSRT